MSLQYVIPRFKSFFTHCTKDYAPQKIYGKFCQTISPYSQCQHTIVLNSFHSKPHCCSREVQQTIIVCLRNALETMQIANYIESQESNFRLKHKWNRCAWQKVSKQPYSIIGQLDMLGLQTDFIRSCVNKNFCTNYFHTELAV